MARRPGRMAVPVMAAAFALMLLSAGVAVAGPGDHGGITSPGVSVGGSAPESALDRSNPAADGDGAHVNGAHGNRENGDGAHGNWHHEDQGGRHDEDDHDDDDHDHDDDATSESKGPANGWNAGGNPHAGWKSGGNSNAGGNSGSDGVSSESVGGTGSPAIPAPTVTPVPAVVDDVAAVSAPVPIAAPEVAPVEVAPAPAVETPPAVPVAEAPAPAAAAPAAGLLPAAREVLATPEARSIAAVLAIALAVLLFLALHGRFDQTEPKLVDGGDGRDLARFR